MTENLFSKLLSLHFSPVPEEDFFTEIVAWLFNFNKKLLFDWIKKELSLYAPYSNCQIETQVEFEKLEGHSTSSRPDFLIKLFDENNTDILMIESKVQAEEGFEQLLRYAEQLSEHFEDARNKYLIYISRSFDPKDKAYVFRNIKKLNIDFKQTLWSEFYTFLSNQPPEPYLDEILAFMKEKHMARITKITPAVLVAFNAYPDVYNFFQSVFDAEVVSKFIKVVGKKPRSEAGRTWNVSEHRRYLLIGDVNQYIIFFIGFLMPESNDRFPSICAFFEIRPTDPNRDRHIQLCSNIVSDTIDKPLKWVGSNLNPQEIKYSGMYLQISFEEILMEVDHILTLKRKFIEFIDEYGRLLEEYPGLID